MIYGNRVPFDGAFPSGDLVIPEYRTGRSIMKSITVDEAPGVRNYPAGAILHFDADADYENEAVGMGHDFNYSILSPQYQRNGDGSYTDVGAKPAVDTFDGERWLRSCGAVTNLVKADIAFQAGGTTPPIVTSNTTHLGLNCHAITFTPSNTSLGYNGCRVIGPPALTTELLTYTGSLSISLSRPLVETEEIAYYWTGSTGFPKIGINAANSASFINTYNTLHSTRTISTGLGGYALPSLFLNYAVTSDLTVYVHSAQLTQTSYPVLYVPPGVTQPASNATTTNGSWFTLPDGSELWQALTGSPLTLATRVRMGVGSADLGVGSRVNTICARLGDVDVAETLYAQNTYAGNLFIVKSWDGIGVSELAATWERNTTLIQVLQVNADGTQFRVGYMIEGTHTAIQWSEWRNYDGSFDPSTLYRLMLGYSNKYPMWFNKITAWKKQVTDAEILEAMA